MESLDQVNIHIGRNYHYDPGYHSYNICCFNTLGGVLGIIPAVQMQDVGLAMTYLGTFCITSTLVMGGFASFYGKMCYWMAEGEDKNRDSRMNRVFLVEIGSACLSVIVGIVWLTLLAVGELNEVFP